MKTTLYRFSADGFNPHLQNHHIEGLKIGLNNNKQKLNNYPQHLQDSINNHYADILPEWEEFSTGIFTFVNTLPDQETLRILFNHLHKTQKESFSWWTAEININQFCFEVDNNRLWTKSGFSTIDKLINKGTYEIYLPSQFLKIENIQQWSNDYRSIYNNINTNKKSNKIF